MLVDALRPAERNLTLPVSILSIDFHLNRNLKEKIPIDSNTQTLFVHSNSRCFYMMLKIVTNNLAQGPDRHGKS